MSFPYIIEFHISLIIEGGQPLVLHADKCNDGTSVGYAASGTHDSYIGKRTEDQPG